jgi:hypothetical protein
MERPPSPTDTEWNTFQVMANPEFVNIRAQKPSFKEESNRFVEDQPSESESEKSQSRSPSPVALSEAFDSISVVAEKMAAAEKVTSAFKPVMPTLKEESEDDASDDEMTRVSKHSERAQSEVRAIRTHSP